MQRNQPESVMMHQARDLTVRFTLWVAQKEGSHGKSRERKWEVRDFPGGSVVKTSPSDAKSAGSIPVGGLRSPMP